MSYTNAYTQMADGTFQLVNAKPAGVRCVSCGQEFASDRL